MFCWKIERQVVASMSASVGAGDFKCGTGTGYHEDAGGNQCALVEALEPD